MKKDKLKKFMLELFLVEIILLLIGFMFVLKPNAEVISPAITSLSGDGTNQVVRYDYIAYGVNWNSITMYNGETIFMQSSYRMSNVNARYNVQFWILSPEAMPVVTLNGTPCTTNFNLQQWTNPGNYNANELILNNVYMVLCSNIPGNTQQFYVRVGNLKPLDGPRMYGIGKNIYIESFGNETQALQNSITTMQNAITQNQTQNSNNIISSVNNMTNQLLNKQNEANQISQETLDYIKDDTPPNSDYTFSPQFEGGGVLTNLINLPLTMVSTLMNALSNQCVPFTARLPFVDVDLTIPCLSEFISFIGATAFFEGIGATAGGFILYNYLKYLALLFDKSLRFELTIKDVI